MSGCGHGITLVTVVESCAECKDEVSRRVDEAPALRAQIQQLTEERDTFASEARSYQERLTRIAEARRAYVLAHEDWHNYSGEFRMHCAQCAALTPGIRGEA